MNEQDANLANDPLLRAARALPREIAPPHDLWPGIEAAIVRERARGRRQWHRWLAQAAAVVLLVGASSGVTVLVMERGGAGTAPAAGPMEPLEFDRVAGVIGDRYHLGPGWVDARNELAANLDAKLAKLPPDTRIAVEANIADIRASIGEINKALSDQPDNRLLRDLLLDAYQEELSLMKKVDSIARSATMRREDI